jgi:hypothetical protein
MEAKSSPQKKEKKEGLYIKKRGLDVKQEWMM